MILKYINNVCFMYEIMISSSEAGFEGGSQVWVIKYICVFSGVCYSCGLHACSWVASQQGEIQLPCPDQVY